MLLALLASKLISLCIGGKAAASCPIGRCLEKALLLEHFARWTGRFLLAILEASWFWILESHKSGEPLGARGVSSGHSSKLPSVWVPHIFVTCHKSQQS